MKTFVRAAILAVLSTAAASGAALAQAGAPTEKPTVVLVHGAFGDAESWDKVIPLLRAQHVPVVSVSIPLTSLADDAAATRRAIDRIPGPVILVGHSWGGTVITEAGDTPKVRALVYVAAFANGPGQSVGDLGKGFAPGAGLSALTVDSQNYASMSAAGFAKFFAPEATNAERELMFATQAPINTKAFGEPATHAAWQGRKSWYVVTTQDQMIVPAQQEAMAKAIGAQVTRVASDHAAMASHPAEVAKAILTAVNAPN
jgi:pimeloyl-ACP methyl ester carboxylesterase